MRSALVVVVVLVIVGAALFLVAATRWNHATATMVRQLLQSSRPQMAPDDLPRELAALPPPVARYLSAALGPQPALVRAARIEQRGTFLIRPEPNGWRDFSAVHYAVSLPPGFVWDARIRMAPGLAVRVRDALLNGVGSMRASIAALRDVARAAGTPEIASGALHRYLAEAVWFPTALLPSAGVRWTAIDDSTARASLSVDSVTVSLDFHFGDDAMVERVYTSARARAVDGGTVPTPWRGRFSRYEERGGVRVPIEAEVEWILPEGAQPYWRGSLTKIEFTTSPAPLTTR